MAIRAILVVCLACVLSLSLYGQTVLSVAQFGAVGDGRADDSNALQNAINALPLGATLDFGSAMKTYQISRRLTLKPGCNYGGRATIRMSGAAPLYTQIAVLKYQATDNVKIDGLTFDSNGMGGGLMIAVDGGGSIPARNVSVTNATFRNTIAQLRGDYDGAIFNPVGWDGGSISNNTFLNCGGGVSITNANNLAIADNSFTAIKVADAIFLLFKTASFDFGKQLQIVRNRGSNLGRMAIEMWATAVPGVDSPLIADNSFANWNSAAGGGGFGISVMTGIKAQVLNNRLVGGGPNLGFGIELGAPYSTVKGNAVTNFVIGIAMHESHHSTVSNNLLIGQDQTGIQVTNAPGDKHSLTLSYNNIWDAKFFGIWFNAGNWGGSTVTGNSIMRQGGQYSDDSVNTFTGIASTPPDAPITLTANSVLQYGLLPPPSFGFLGFRLNGSGGSNQGSTYERNVVLSNVKAGNSIGLLVNEQGGADGVRITSNVFEALGWASGGAGSTGAIVTSNRVVGCSNLGPLDLNHQ